MQTRQLGPFTVNAIGLGCMSMSHAYGSPEPVEAERTLAAAIDIGYNFLDTAALYGFGKNEELLGKVVSHRRSEFVLASKCGLWKNAEGKREVNGRPELIREVCEGALQRLKTDVIDLYYLHRRDFTVPIEDSVGEMSRLVEEGKIRTIGLSEVGVETIRRAHAVHPLTAIQNEYCLWSRNVELGVLDLCAELNIALVAFSPLGRAFFTGKLPRDKVNFESNDIRNHFPRFQEINYRLNQSLLPPYEAIAEEVGCTMAQLALAWCLAKATHIIPIPGTRHYDYMIENFGAIDIQLTGSQIERLDQLVNRSTVHGERYNSKTQKEIDTEKYPDEL
jgi:aryl-alcohol dehydrogenase-like predicted oxidoreductase